MTSDNSHVIPRSEATLESKTEADEIATSGDALLAMTPTVEDRAAEATTPEATAAEATTAEATEHVPLWQRIGDMFPEVKPQQSMAAWDDDTPF